MAQQQETSFFGDLFSTGKKFVGDFFDRLNTSTVQPAVQVQQGRRTIGQSGWFAQEVQALKDHVKQQSAQAFRESKTGQEFIAEVRDQEINQALKNIGPVVGIVGLFLLVLK